MASGRHICPANLAKRWDRCLKARQSFTKITLASVNLQDCQRLLAFNDLFLAVRSHVSPCIGSLAGSAQRYSPPMAPWFQLGRVRRVGSLPPSTWLLELPHSAGSESVPTPHSVGRSASSRPAHDKNGRPRRIRPPCLLHRKEALLPHGEVEQPPRRLSVRVKVGSDTILQILCSHRQLPSRNLTIHSYYPLFQNRAKRNSFGAILAKIV